MLSKDFRINCIQILKTQNFHSPLYINAQKGLFL